MENGSPYLWMVGLYGSRATCSETIHLTEMRRATHPWRTPHSLVALDRLNCNKQTNKQTIHSTAHSNQMGLSTTRNRTNGTESVPARQDKLVRIYACEAGVDPAMYYMSGIYTYKWTSMRSEREPYISGFVSLEKTFGKFSVLCSYHVSQ